MVALGWKRRQMLRLLITCSAIVIVILFTMFERGNKTGSDVASLNYDLAETVLVPDLIVPNVHFLWCRKRLFEFKHYLSVISAIRAIKPDSVFLHYEYLPDTDRRYYHQWLDELKKDVPFFILKRMDRELKQFCSTRFRDIQTDVIVRLLDRDGGIYVGENTWLLEFPVSKRQGDVEIALQRDSTEGYVILRNGMLNRYGNSYRSLISSAGKVVKWSSCGLVKNIYDPDPRGVVECLVLEGEPYESFFPMDIWELEDPFGRLARKLFYGTEVIRRPVPSYDSLVPNIGHMIWLGGGPMDYVFYLSLLSLLFVANVETVYVHGDVEPAGNYWKEIKNLEQTKYRVKFITRNQPFQVYQGKIPRDRSKALMSDLIRIDLMIKYGGIYTDTDAIWVKPLSEADRGYEAVASYDWIDWSWPFPDSVNFGISYGKRNAPFWKIFRESLRTLHNEVHGFTGVMMPYKLLEKYPHLLRIDRRLQVICYHSKCHPTYVDDYHNMTKDHTNMNSIPNWRQDVHAFHWTFPNPPELESRKTLLNSTGIFAELGKNVLKLAGLL